MMLNHHTTCCCQPQCQFHFRIVIFAFAEICLHHVVALLIVNSCHHMNVFHLPLRLYCPHTLRPLETKSFQFLQRLFLIFRNFGFSELQCASNSQNFHF